MRNHGDTSDHTVRGYSSYPRWTGGTDLVSDLFECARGTTRGRGRDAGTRIVGPLTGRPWVTPRARRRGGAGDDGQGHDPYHRTQYRASRRWRREHETRRGHGGHGTRDDRSG